MSEVPPVAFVEDRVPASGIDATVEEMVELYGGEMKSSSRGQYEFVLPFRRGVAAAGGVHCTLSWTESEGGEAMVKLVCDRDVEPPKAQRIAMLAAGVVGALLFTMWPFFPKAATQLGALAWIGGAVAIAVYLLSLKKTSGGLASDFLQRLARRQRAAWES